MTRRVIGFVALFAIVLSFVATQAPVSASLSAQSTAASGLSGTVVAGTVRIHSAPTTTSATVATVKLGDAVTVTGRNASGTWVQVLTAANISGWSGSEFIKLNQGKLSDLTVIDALAATATAAATDSGTCGTNGKLVKGKVNVGSLILRTQPNTTADSIGTLKAGAALTILGTSASGAWLAVTTSNGLTGWVGSAFVRITSGKLIDIQIVNPASITSSPVSATLAATMNATMSATAAMAGTAVATPCATAVATAGATASAKVVTAKVAVASLRLRSNPSNTAETLKTLTKGENLTILGTSSTGSWFLAESSDGIVGWVGAAYVTLTEGKLVDIQIVSNDAASAATPVATEVGTPAS